MLQRSRHGEHGTFVVALLAVIVLAAAGCGGGDEKKASGNNLIFWTAEDNPERVKATQAIIDRFQQQTAIKVKLVAIAEDQLQVPGQAAAAAGCLPDVSVPSRSASCNWRPTASSTPPPQPPSSTRSAPTHSRSAPSSLVTADGRPLPCPATAGSSFSSTGRTCSAGRPGRAPHIRSVQLRPPSSAGEGMAGIVAATGPGDSFTQQTLEHFALANGCQLVDEGGTITLPAHPCVDTYTYYVDMIRDASVQGNQDADTNSGHVPRGPGRLDHLVVVPARRAGRAARRRPPTCPQCEATRSFLAKNSGVVTAFRARRERTVAVRRAHSFAIATDADQDSAKFVEFMMSDGYVDWLALAPEGKVPRPARNQRPADRVRRRLEPARDRR